MAFQDTIRRQLEEHGLLPVKNRPDWYWRAENPMLYLVCLDFGTEPRESLLTEFAAFCGSMRQQMAQLHCTRLVALTVLVDKSMQDVPVENVEKFFDPCRTEEIYPVFWYFSTESGTITAPKGQPDRLIGIEKLLRAAAKGEEPQVLPLRQEGAHAYPVATICIFLICLAALLWTLYSGRENEIISRFGMSRAGIANGEYYRLITCMFLHGSWMHLLSNSIYLYYFGTRAERLLGTGRFLLLYFVSGICGSLCSMLLGSGGLSIGASGAIFGLLGAMLLLTRRHGARDTGMSYTTMLLLAISALCIGFLEPGVDNFAHIGGLLGGAAVFALLLRQKNA